MNSSEGRNRFIDSSLHAVFIGNIDNAGQALLAKLRPQCRKFRFVAIEADEARACRDHRFGCGES